MTEGASLAALRLVVYSSAFIGFYIWGLEGLILSLGIAYFGAEVICAAAAAGK